MVAGLGTVVSAPPLSGASPLPHLIGFTAQTVGGAVRRFDLPPMRRLIAPQISQPATKPQSPPRPPRQPAPTAPPQLAASAPGHNRQRATPRLRRQIPRHTPKGWTCPAAPNHGPRRGTARTTPWHSAP